jgi:hypothetical protein
MATTSINDANMQPEEVARVINLKRVEEYEAAVRAKAMGWNDTNFSDRDTPLYGNPHRSPTANL